ncbi:MAG: GNAT family N-acetyltransferase [Acidimicrobiia bacterium]|nr:GNAT family N-acetyltransferase [Acidimicrobiia bacterium]
MITRLANPTDAARLAALHATRISEGFLPTLGPRFLTRLYRRLILDPDSFAIVADEGGDVVGFAAAASDIGALYRSFLLRDGVVASIGAAPALLRSWRRVIETLRYPEGSADLPDAEILSVAVDATAGGRGVGTKVVTEALSRLRDSGVSSAKVVVGADNETALAMYRRCGFENAARIEVHGGRASEVLVWKAP